MRFLGVTVMPEFVQTEGIERVLDNLTKAGVTAVTTSPYVLEPADARTGGREPPDDAGAGAVRLLDRPLWGRRELFVRTAPAFVPEKKFYAGLPYQPPEPTDLTMKEGRIVGDFIKAAQRRHLKVYLQVQAAIPPGYRVQFGGPIEADQPRLPDGRIPPRRLAKNGSLASPNIRAYGRALIRDLLRMYPDINGLCVDWPEYPPYFLDDVILDFGPHAQAAAQRLNLPFTAMRDQAAALYRHLHGQLRDADLEPFLDGDAGRFAMVRHLANAPALAQWLQFKAILAAELLTEFRDALSRDGGREKELIANAFAPPWTLASGLDFGRAGRHVQGFCVKLYTMHWPMMLHFYGDVLRKANPKLSESLLTRFLVRFLDIGDDSPKLRLDDYRYPEPEKAHPVTLESQARKVRQAQAEAGTTPVFALAHGYGPAEDFRKRLEVAWKASGQKVWINRYGYLSDAKLEIVRQVCR